MARLQQVKIIQIVRREATSADNLVFCQVHSQYICQHRRVLPPHPQPRIITPLSAVHSALTVHFLYLGKRSRSRRSTCWLFTCGDTPGRSRTNARYVHCKLYTLYSAFFYMSSFLSCLSFCSSVCLSVLLSDVYSMNMIRWKKNIYNQMEK